MAAGVIGLFVRFDRAPRDGRERLAGYSRVTLRFLASLRFRFTLGFS